MRLFCCISSTNPFFLTLFLLILAARLGITAGSVFSKWIYIAIFIVFLGGIIILFFYVVSLTKPQKNVFLYPSKILLLGPILTGLYFQRTEHDNFKRILFHLYNYMNFQRLIYLTIVLFICLISVVKISENFKGALIRIW